MQQVFEIGAVNVVLHPHPPGQYEKLLRHAYSLRKRVKIHGDRHALMTSFQARSRDGADYSLEGEISTFSHLDPALPWINLETEDSASDDELGEIPEHLRPNLRRCQFYFDVASHKLFFLTTARKGGISPKLMAKYLEELFVNDEIVEKFGTPKVTVLPDREAISKILAWKKIRRLEIHAVKPNPGDYDPEDLEEFERSLADQNLEQMNVELVAEKNKYIDMSERTQTLVAIASDNGWVEAKGHDRRGAPEQKSTKSGKPFGERGDYYPENETYWDAFKRVSRTAALKFRRG